MCLQCQNEWVLPNLDKKACNLRGNEHAMDKWICALSSISVWHFCLINFLFSLHGMVWYKWHHVTIILWKAKIQVPWVLARSNKFLEAQWNWFCVPNEKMRLLFLSFVWISLTQNGYSSSVEWFIFHLKRALEKCSAPFFIFSYPLGLFSNSCLL